MPLLLLFSSTIGPTINTQPSNAIVIVGGIATFTVSATASAGSLTYQWKLNGVNVSTGTGGTTASYTTGTLAITDTGNSYTCVVTDSNSSITTNAAILTMYFVPAIMWIRA